MPYDRMSLARLLLNPAPQPVQPQNTMAGLFGLGSPPPQLPAYGWTPLMTLASMGQVMPGMAGPPPRDPFAVERGEDLDAVDKTWRFHNRLLPKEFQEQRKDEENNMIQKRRERDS